jgi:hypothetical protein
MSRANVLVRGLDYAPPRLASLTRKRHADYSKRTPVTPRRDREEG